MGSTDTNSKLGKHLETGKNIPISQLQDSIILETGNQIFYVLITRYQKLRKRKTKFDFSLIYVTDGIPFKATITKEKLHSQPDSGHE